MKRLDALYRNLKKAAREMAGYPENQNFDFSKLYRFLEFSINNCGDPFLESPTYRLNTHAFEREVIDELAHLFHAQKRNYWGYVTNGGTEGNLFGLYVAREMYPKGIVYCSDQTHYSIYKNIHLLKIPCVKVKSVPNGEIDYNELKTEIHKRRKMQPIIVANIGTTMKGAVDQVSEIQDVLAELDIRKYYIHCDAALAGMILPFVPGKGLKFDFGSHIDSMAISGHKMIGMPIPCGVVLVEKSHSDQIARDIEYTGTVDNTITGSRNGITPLFLWYMILHQKEKIKKNVVESLEKAEYAVKQFQKKGIKAWRNEDSITVIFPRPSDKTRNLWQLAVEDNIAHIITLPQVTYKIIDQIVNDVVNDIY